MSGDFHPGLSNLNLFCVLRDSSFAALQALAPVAKWWDRQKQPPPLCMTRRELERSTDVFTIELLDMQQHHRVLFGENVVQGLRVSMHVHRVQVEYELREKLILLRQQVLLASGNDSRLWDLLLHSVPSFGTLFRHALIALGRNSPTGRREADTGAVEAGGIRSARPFIRRWMFGSTKRIPRRLTSTILRPATWRQLRRLRPLWMRR